MGSMLLEIFPVSPRGFESFIRRFNRNNRNNFEKISIFFFLEIRESRLFLMVL